MAGLSGMTLDDLIAALREEILELESRGQFEAAQSLQRIIIRAHRIEKERQE